MGRIPIELTSLVLPPDCGIIRNPTRDPALRHADFPERYDADTVFFDLFRTPNPSVLLAVGPPLHNLATDLDLRFRAEPSGAACRFRKMTRINCDRLYIDVPPGTERIVAQTNIGDFELIPGADHTDTFRDKRTVFTLSRDNDLVWIRDWAAYYARVHGADAAVVYDNGSTRYDLDELSRALATVDELDCFAVVPWPFRYGPADYRRDLTVGCGDCDYCQRGAMEHAATRLLGKASGVANVDIDEFIYPMGERNVFDALEASETGYLQIDGLWIEAVPDAAGAANRHAAYFMQTAATRFEKYVFKWVIDPRRNSDFVQWQIHAAHPAGPSLSSIDFRYGHFRAINTNWDLHRLGSGEVLRTDAPETEELLPVAELRDALARAFPDRDEGMIPTAPLEEDAGKTIGRITEQARELDAAPDTVTAAYWNQKAFVAQIDTENDDDTPIDHSARAVAMAPGNFHFLAAYLGLLRKTRRYDDALRAIKDADHPWSDTDRARLAAIEAFLRNEAGSPGAITAIRTAIGLRPEKPGYRLLLGRIEEAAGDISAAERSYREAIALAERDERVQQEIEEIAARTYAVAVFDFSDRPFFTENLPPDQPWRALAEFLMRTGNAGEAAAHSAEVVRRAGLSPHSYLLHIRCLEAAGKPQEAETAKRKLLRLAQTLHERGPVTEWLPAHRAKYMTAMTSCLTTAWILNGQEMRAMPLAYQLLEHDPVPTNEVRSVARALLNAGEAGACEALVSGLIERAPQDIGSWNLRLEARKSLGDLQGVRADVDRVAGLAPERGQPWSVLGLMLRDLGRKAEALDAFAEAIRREPTEPRFHMQRIWTLLGEDRIEPALIAAREVVERFPGDHRGYLGLARSLNRLGKRDDALAAARRSLALKPGLPEIVKLVDQLSA